MGRPQRTPAQNRAMWGLVSQISRQDGSSREEAAEVLRACCVQASGQEHTSQLTPDQADQVLALMRQRVGVSSTASPPRPPARGRPVAPSRTGGITPRQQEVIAALFRQVGMTDRGRQMNFARRQCKVPWPQTQAHADQLIEPLKAMAIRHVRPMDAWRRAQALLGHDRLDAWQRRFIPDLVRQFQEAEPAGTLDQVLSPHKLLKLVEAEVACGVSE